MSSIQNDQLAETVCATVFSILTAQVHGQQDCAPLVEVGILHSPVAQCRKCKVLGNQKGYCVTLYSKVPPRPATLSSYCPSSISGPILPKLDAMTPKTTFRVRRVNDGTLLVENPLSTGGEITDWTLLIDSEGNVLVDGKVLHAAGVSLHYVLTPIPT